MSRRRLVPLGLAVTVLLALVAVAARGRPLSASSGGGAGPSRTFIDYAFTTVLIIIVLAALVALYGLFFHRPALERKQSSPTRTLRSIVTLIVIAALVFVIARHVFAHSKRGTPPIPKHVTTQPVHGKKHGLPTHSSTAAPGFRWPEAAVVGGLLLLALVAAGIARARSRREAPRLQLPPETLAIALDESLDDLRSDPDLRRAIVATYARMELALAVAGLPRRPSEAPLEYLDRALVSLEASAAAVQRLTDLFEWARFSHHEPEPWMRDEAVDALVAVRDELRAEEPVAS